MNELVDDARDDVVDAEAGLGAGQLGLEDDLEKEVAELLAKVPHVLRLDGVDHLARLLEHVLAERVERLLAVPGAAARTEEPLHQPHEPRDRLTVLCRERRGRGEVRARRKGSEGRTWTRLLREKGGYAKARM